MVAEIVRLEDVAVDDTSWLDFTLTFSFARLLLGVLAMFLALGMKETGLVLTLLATVSIVMLLIVFLWVRSSLPRPRPNTVGFFHPFADGGGGGERVLWAAVHALQQQRPDLTIIIYCGEGSTPQTLAIDASRRFNITVAPDFTTLGLTSRAALRPQGYPRFTLIRQAFASVCVAVEALRHVVPEVWIDTTGWAFPYPIVRLAGARVAAYVHYPTISTDMLTRVRQRRASYNNDDEVAASTLKSGVKLAYYHFVASVYGVAGGCANVAIVNSTWTRRHIAQLWWTRRQPALVYPPCDTAALQALPLDRRLKRLYVVSVAQFRPEKNHELQLKAFAAARKLATRLQNVSVATAVLSARLVMVGGCRGPDDEARLAALRDLAAELGLLEEDAVEFRVNVPFQELCRLLGNAVVGLHTMEDEHFGISVVEYMAAGVVPVAHASGGPKEDIVVPEPGFDGGAALSTGYLCRSLEEYRDALMTVLGMDQRERLEVAARARRRAASFSDGRFESEFMEAVGPILPQKRAVFDEMECNGAAASRKQR